jgi:hypothetical protein
MAGILAPFPFPSLPAPSGSREPDPGPGQHPKLGGRRPVQDGRGEAYSGSPKTKKVSWSCGLIGNEADDLLPDVECFELFQQPRIRGLAAHRAGGDQERLTNDAHQLADPGFEDDVSLSKKAPARALLADVDRVGRVDVRERLVAGMTEEGERFAQEEFNSDPFADPVEREAA